MRLWLVSLVLLSGAAAVHVRVELQEHGARSENSRVICETEGSLLSGTGWPQEGSQGAAVQVECEESECEAVSPSRDSHNSWVAILHYPDVFTFKETTILDQVGQAMLWGASAVIILALKTETFSNLEFDSSILSKPVILISSNVTKILGVLANSTRILVSMGLAKTDESVAKFSTLTLWATCGRMWGLPGSADFHWEGTVCMDVPVGKTDLTEFWAAFYTSLLFIFLLILMKAGRPADSNQDLSSSYFFRDERRQAAERALCAMRVERVRRVAQLASERCAICLDGYNLNQELRVVWCGHRFHRGCVDPWLLLHCTCPLCKLDVLRQSHPYRT